MIKTITSATTAYFTPMFDGNTDLTNAEQIRIEYKRPTIAMKEKLFPRQFDFDQTGQATMSVTVDRKKLIKELTIKIENCGYIADTVERKISTVDQLFDAPIDFDPLIEELYTFYNEVINTKVNEKN